MKKNIQILIEDNETPEDTYSPEPMPEIIPTQSPKGIFFYKILFLKRGGRKN